MSAKRQTRGYAGDAILAFGSNIGDRRANIDRAIELLTQGGDIRLVRRSRDYETPPWGVTDQDPFVNAAASVTTSLSARELLRRCQQVENDMGRVRRLRWGPRVIDVDILTHRDGPSSDAELTLPHPRVTERAFVLLPLADVAPQWTVAGKTVAEWLSETDTSGIAALGSK